MSFKPPSQPRTRLQLTWALVNPLLVFDAYTFRWLTFDPHDEDNNQEQAMNKVTNIGLISALILTVFASWLQALSTTSFANYGAHEATAGAISSVTLSLGVVFLVMSVVNSVLLLLAVNDAEDDHHATILLQKLGLWFTLPALYFYIGMIIGTLGWLVWIPAVFALVPALVIIVLGFIVGICINALYYNYIVLCVYEAREECGMSIPAPPAIIAWLISCTRKSTPKICDTLAVSTKDDGGRASAMHALDQALRHVGHPESPRPSKKNGTTWCLCRAWTKATQLRWDSSLARLCGSFAALVMSSSSRNVLSRHQPEATRDNSTWPAFQRILCCLVGWSWPDQK